MILICGAGAVGYFFQALCQSLKINSLLVTRSYSSRSHKNTLVNSPLFSKVTVTANPLPSNLANVSLVLLTTSQCNIKEYLDEFNHCGLPSTSPILLFQNGISDLIINAPIQYSSIYFCPLSKFSCYFSDEFAIQHVNNKLPVIDLCLLSRSIQSDIIVVLNKLFSSVHICENSLAPVYTKLCRSGVHLIGSLLELFHLSPLFSTNKRADLRIIYDEYVEFAHSFGKESVPTFDFPFLMSLLDSSIYHSSSMNIIKSKKIDDGYAHIISKPLELYGVPHQSMKYTMSYHNYFSTLLNEYT